MLYLKREDYKEFKARIEEKLKPAPAPEAEPARKET
jgi:hypothetical protein